VKLDPVPASAKPATMNIKGSYEAKELKNILVGEVWICSGQSNMQMSVSSSWDADLEIAAAKYPNIRLISVPQVGTQEPQNDFKGAVGRVLAAERRRQFSAVGFFFGRVLHKTLDVPVGLIDNAWGGSAAEAWVRRDVLEKDKRFAAHGQVEEKEAESSPETPPRSRYEANPPLGWLRSKEAIKQKQPQTFPHALPRAPRDELTVATPPRQHLQRRAAADHRLRHQGRDLVSGRKQRRPRL
jgi:sialate O-acetylesterase